MRRREVKIGREVRVKTAVDNENFSIDVAGHTGTVIEKLEEDYSSTVDVMVDGWCRESFELDELEAVKKSKRKSSRKK